MAPRQFQTPATDEYGQSTSQMRTKSSINTIANKQAGEVRRILRRLPSRAEARVNLPSLMSIRESPVGSGSESPVGSTSRFSMVPWEVGIDPKLTHLDTRVYIVLAACRRGCVVKIGTRLLARYA